MAEDRWVRIISCRHIFVTKRRFFQYFLIDQKNVAKILQRLIMKGTVNNVANLQTKIFTIFQICIASKPLFTTRSYHTTTLFQEQMYDPKLYQRKYDFANLHRQLERTHLTANTRNRRQNDYEYS